jgi:hypothetical protein
MTNEKGMEEQPRIRFEEDLQELLDQGWTPTFKKRVGRWYMQKWGAGARIVPRELEDIAREAYDRRMAERARTKDSTLQVQLRAKRLDERRPILEKEIETTAWFHNLILDLGHYTYHKIVQYVPWGEEHAQDEAKALKLLQSYIDDLVKLRENVDELRRLEVENMLAEQFLRRYDEVLDQLMERVKKQDLIIQAMLQDLCPECQQRALARLITMMSLTQFSQPQKPQKQPQVRPQPQKQ